MNRSTEDNTRTGLEIAVIGLAARFPGSRTIDEFWDNLKGGIESIDFFSEGELLESGINPRLMENQNYVRASGVLDDVEYFDALFFDYTPREADIMDPQTRIFHECAWHALEDSGYDPYAYNKLIGCYAGASSNFFWEAHCLLSGKTSDLGLFDSFWLYHRDSMANRVAHRLNLSGPVVNIQTACSTSLVAIHMACQGLLSGECDMALAGGVTVTTNNRGGYIYEEGMVFSPDGHCRAFDAEARGTIFGCGVGVVVLKRLDDAVEDGDHIYALVKGSSINNDGMNKASFTAPSIEGQAAVIRQAQQMAEVEPESIGYVETHGTGTTLGDPIEIEALKLAFNTTKTGFCGIGSVKTNFGHLDMSACVSSFIKTALALHLQLLPPSLHFNSHSPKIDFEHSPFFVVRRLTGWKSDGHRRRAGVSSFGIGGTNAHAVLEEAPPVQTSSSSRPFHIIALSAKTEPALHRLSRNLVEFFKQHPERNIADVAYTLTVGRHPLPYRQAFVCASLDEAVEQETGVFEIPKEGCSTIFLFAGLGSQYVNMGRGIYEGEPVFRKEMDRCFEILQSLGSNIKDILYPDRGEGEDAARLIGSTAIAQQVNFVFSYALAKMLIEWGIRPGAMIGYSFGEYVAACTAGVISLADALKLILTRGRLLDQVPEGGMLSVPLPKKDLKPLLNNELSVAIDNGPSCIVAGSSKDIDTLEGEMQRKKLLCMRLKTSHALHSRMMEPILKEFEKNCVGFDLKKPNIKYISNVTGTWIGDEEANDPGYWARHLGNTVRFADGIQRLAAEPRTIFIEIGPGRDLKALVSRYMDQQKGQRVENLVRPQDKEVNDVYYLLTRIARLWLFGQPVDWPHFWAQERRSRLSLPNYPFERQLFKNDKDFLKKGAARLLEQSQVGRAADISDWFYIPSFKRTVSPLILQNESEAAKAGHWLVFMDDCGIAENLGAGLKEKGIEVVAVRRGEQFHRFDDHNYAIRANTIEDYDQLLKHMIADHKNISAVIHLWSLSPFQDIPQGKESFLKYQEAGFYSLLFFIQTLAPVQEKAENSPIRVTIVANHLVAVQEGEAVVPEKTTILGLAGTIPQEYPNISCRCIDVMIPDEDPGAGKKIAAHLMAELLYETKEPIVAYRGTSRWVQCFESLPLKQRPGCPMKLKPAGVYLITGGLGRDSLERALYLAQTVKARLVLTGRSGLPEWEYWQQWLESHADEDEVGRKMRRVLQLEELGSEVLIVKGDVADEGDMYRVMEQIDKRFGRLDGVIHAAGMTSLESSVIISHLGYRECEWHFRPKIYGLYVLEKVLQGRSLDFCLLTSSIVSILGGGGLSAYAAASTFMDAFAYKQSLRGASWWISLNWEGSTPQETRQAFHRILSIDSIPQVIVSRWDLEERIQRRVPVEKPPAAMNRPNLMGTYVEPGNEVEQKLVDTWQKFFGIEPLGITDDFFELGGDSLKAITMIAKIHREFAVKISLAEFFKMPTISDLSTFINRAEKEEYRSIEPVEKREYYPVSASQRRMYVLQQLQRDSIGYNETLVSLFEDEIDMEKLERVLSALTQRHEILRTSIEMIAEEPVQKVLPGVKVADAVEYYETGEDKVKELIENFIRPYDLSKPPLFRIGVINIEGGRNILVRDTHHIITDGISLDIFIKELMALYFGKELQGNRLQYKDYSGWQIKQKEVETMKGQEEYWLSLYRGDIPVLNLPTDYKRPSVKSFEGTNVRFTIEKTEYDSLKKLALESDVTLYILLLAIFNIFLSKLSGQEDIIIGTPVAGRAHEDLHNIIGVFVNTLALRSFPQKQETFGEFLAETRENTLRAFENQDFQFEDLIEKLEIERDTSRNPLFDVQFVSLVADGPSAGISGEDMPELKLAPFRFEGVISKFDLALEVRESNGHLFFIFQYCRRLFKRETIDRFIDYFKEIISIILRDKDIKLEDISVSHDLLFCESEFSEEEYSDFTFNG